MKKRGTSQFHDLVATGQNVINIVPTAGAELGTFETGGLRAVDSRGWYNYVRRYHHMNSFVLNQNAGTGNILNWDQYGKANQSMELTSRDFGVMFTHKNTRGPVLQHLIGPIGMNYGYAQPARNQIAAADGANQVHLFNIIPLAHECMNVGDESAQATLFMEAGTLETMVAPTGVFEGDSAGALTTAVSLRIQSEYFSSPKKFIGTPIQWRDREIAGGGDAPILRLVGQQSGYNGLRQGAGLAGMYWLTDSPSDTGGPAGTSIGMGGPDGTDIIAAIEIQALGQRLVKNLDGYYTQLRSLKKFQPRAGLGAAIMTDGAGWPLSMGSQPTGALRPASNPSNMFLPILTPGQMQDSSKVPRWNGDLQINFTTTAAITAPHRVVTMEMMEFAPQQIQVLAARAGFGSRARRKRGGRSEVSNAGQLRYTAVEFQ